MFRNALCRRPGPDFANGLTTADLGEPDLDLALLQHGAYVKTLGRLGLDVQVMDALADFPDACFVEDPAVVFPELAVLTNPGAESRRGEVDTIADALAHLSNTMTITPPGTLDGGDVLIIGRSVFVGLSVRTNAAGVDQLGNLLAPYGYETTPVPIKAGLHLKSDVNWLGGEDLMIAEHLADRPEFSGYRRVVVEADENYACNTLWINDTLITPAGFPKCRAKLERLGRPVVELEMSEFQKMDGGLTCLSLRY